MPVFPIRGPISLLFFHAVLTPKREGKRLSQNDSSGQAVFLGQLVEEGAIYTQSSSRGSEKCRPFGTSK
jgi:hypothetical protein